MDADEEFSFPISALICSTSICGQFRIRLRLAALAFRAFALNPPSDLLGQTCGAHDETQALA
jgi:hypothetical protein